VEKGKAPDSIIATHTNSQGFVDRTRPLCPYPQVAKYKGSGNINDAENFVCAAP
jgi:feruloyl esterase